MLKTRNYYRNTIFYHNLEWNKGIITSPYIWCTVTAVMIGCDFYRNKEGVVDFVTDVNSVVVYIDLKDVNVTVHDP